MISRAKLAALALVIAGGACAKAAPPPAPPPPPPAPAPSASASVAPPPETPDDAFRKTPPEIGATPTFAPPEIDEARLSNGARVLVVERHAAPFVALDVVFEHSRPLDPVAATMAADSLVAGQLPTGTTARDALDALGARVTADGDDDATRMEIAFGPREIDGVLDVVADVLKARPAPALDARRHVPAPAHAAAIRLAAADAFPPGHPYRVSPEGTEEEIARTKAALVARTVAMLVEPASTTFVAVGDVGKAALVAKLEARLAGWKSNATKPVPPPEKLAKGVLVVDDPSRDDVAIVVWFPGVARSSTDYPAAALLAQLATADLWEALRKNVPDVDAFGLDARLGEHRLVPMWSFSIAAPRARALDVARTMIETLDGLAKIHPLPETLAGRKALWASALESRFDRSFDTADAIGRALAHGAPPDDDVRLRDRILALQVDDLRRVASTHLKRDEARLVLDGDTKTLEPEVKALGLGPIRTKHLPKPKSPAR